MKTDKPRLLSVSRAAMDTPMNPVPDVLIKFEFAVAPPEIAEDEQPPVVVGVPTKAFAWS